MFSIGENNRIEKKSAEFEKRLEKEINLELLFCKLEVRFYMNGPSKLHAAISSKQFFGFKLHI